MKKRKVTIDGVTLGTRLEGAIDLQSSEVAKVRRAFKMFGAIEGDSELVVLIPGRSSTMQLALRRNKFNQNDFYINMTGNPVTFLYKGNNYGFAEADVLIVRAYLKCLDTVTRIPERIRQAVVDKNINIHSLEFATYTIPVADKDRILNAWAYMYRVGDSNKAGMHVSLLDMLNLKMKRKHVTHTSVCLKLMSGDGREEEACLMAYDKAEEIRDKALKEQRIGKVPPDIEHRIRLELQLSYGWFRRRSIDGAKIKTLRDLCNYIDKRYSGSWTIFLAAQFKWALDKTCLFHMWEFKAKPILTRTYELGMAGYMRLPYEAYLAMLMARSTIGATDEDRRQFLLGNAAPMLRKTRAYRSLVIGLDMGLVNNEENA